MSLKDIIADLEKAEGPSRELDAGIARVLGFEVRVFMVPKDHPIFKEGGGLEFMAGPDGANVAVPPYTSSVDCALTLVPEGQYIELRRHSDGWYALVGPHSTDPKKYAGSQKPAAIALAIAALRAIASQKGE